MIRQQMERGELSSKPESELGELGHENKQLVSDRRGANVASSIRVKARTHTNDVASDDFFGNDDEQDSLQSETSDS
jgi:hypothetical protein